MINKYYVCVHVCNHDSTDHAAAWNRVTLLLCFFARPLLAERCSAGRGFGLGGFGKLYSFSSCILKGSTKDYETLMIFMGTRCCIECQHSQLDVELAP